YRFAKIWRMICIGFVVFTTQCGWSLAPVSDSKTAPIKSATVPSTLPDPSILTFNINLGALSNLTGNQNTDIATGPVTFSGIYTNSAIQGTKKSPVSLLNSNNTKNADDSLMDFKVAYKNNGLTMSAEVNETGQKFLGFSDTVKKLKAIDPNSANMLTLGTKKTNYNMSYTGIKGLSMSSNLNTVTVDQTGNVANGMTQTINNNNLGLNLGSKYRFDYNISNLVETWDPTVAVHDSREVQSQLLKLSGKMGNKSSFSLSQGTTNTNQGKAQTDLTEYGYAMNWNEWNNLSLTGNYLTRFTKQTNEQAAILNMDMKANITPNMKLTGKLVNNSTERTGVVGSIDNNFNQLRLETKVLPNVQMTNEYVTKYTPDNASIKSINHQAIWKISPSWTSTILSGSNDNSLSGLEERLECGFKGTIGPIKNPATLLLQTGQYNLDTNKLDYDREMVSVQLLSYRPLVSTSMAFGYYDGPILTANSLIYRSWGNKPVAITGVWRDVDFMRYREYGGELTQTLNSKTKLVGKHFRDEIDNNGEQYTSEIGVERQIGKGSIQLGYNDTQLPNNTEQHGTVWRVYLPFTKPLPAWAKSTLRGTVFQDGSTWGFGQLPTWVTTPESGMTVSQRISQVNKTESQNQSVTLGSMASDDVYLQTGYERNPNSNVNMPEQDDRLFFHSAYAISPDVQVFARFTQEPLLDKPAVLSTRSFGMMGRISPTTRLQLQMNWLTQDTKTDSIDGKAYLLQFERSINADNSLTLKYRFLPEQFRGKLNTQQAELGYRLTF
ncbi:MAG: hypothetical protein WCO98_15620, partial [bacterium]